MLIACLAGLAEVATASGPVDRAERLAVALKSLVPADPAPGPVERAWMNEPDPAPNR
jgi:hypothetical protein